jgi:hypothetical protein
MAFDPQQREVTRVFQLVGKTAQKKPLYREAGFQLVSYDGEADRFVEPRNASFGADVVTSCIIPRTLSQLDRIVGVEFIEGRMSEVFAFAPDFVDL